MGDASLRVFFFSKKGFCIVSSATSVNIPRNGLPEGKGGGGSQNAGSQNALFLLFGYLPGPPFRNIVLTPAS